MELNYQDWAYNVPAITICFDYTNDSFIDEYYQRFENVTVINNETRTYHDYRHYMKKIGSLNAENIHLIDEFEQTELFRSLSGEELYDIALGVWTNKLLKFS